MQNLPIILEVFFQISGFYFEFSAWKPWDGCFACNQKPKSIWVIQFPNLVGRGYYSSTDPVQGNSVEEGGSPDLPDGLSFQSQSCSRSAKTEDLKAVARRTCQVGSHHSQVGATQGQSWL